jgi:hypothetical protein
MAGIEGDSPVTPQMREVYKQECSRGVELFRRSLQEYQKSQIPAQKEEYKDVMEKALQIVHETATQCLSKEMQKQELELEKGYNDFIANPSPDNLKKLDTNLQHFQKEI